MIRQDHIYRNFEDASAIYISAVYGGDMASRGFVVYLLNVTLTDIFRKKALDMFTQGLPPRKATEQEV